MNSIDYRVRSGDTLTTIARRHKVTVDALAHANGLTDPDRVTIGHVLTIPAMDSSTPRTTGKKGAGVPPSQSSSISSLDTPRHAPLAWGKETGFFGRVRNEEGVNLHKLYFYCHSAMGEPLFLLEGSLSGSLAQAKALLQRLLQLCKARKITSRFDYAQVNDDGDEISEQFHVN